jgi:hypothetical protein
MLSKHYKLCLMLLNMKYKFIKIMISVAPNEEPAFYKEGSSLRTIAIVNLFFRAYHYHPVVAAA